MSERLAKKVLIVGWDAADWKVITPLLDSGKMPALETIVNGGVMGNLASFEPYLSPMVWTTIATGLRSDKHGILGFTEPDPESGSVRPVSCRSRKVKAFWNMFTQKGIKTNMIGWWPSHPAEPIDGVCLSNLYHHARAEYGKDWPMDPSAVHPQRLSEKLAELRVHPAELTEAHLLPFVPDAAKVDQKTDKRLASLAKIIAECSSVHAAATWIMANEPWDVTAVYYDAIDHFCHGFMNFHPPRMKHVPQELYEMYKGVVEGGYRYHDMMLGRLLSLAGPDTTVILISDHGFHSDHLRPKAIPKEPAGPATQHRPYGIFCMKGPHIRKDERIYGATLLDIVPTLLTLMGLPVGRDMPGKALVQAFEKPVKPEHIDSWETVGGECGMHPPDMRQDPFEAQAAMDQLAALGYIELDGDGEQRRKVVVREGKYNLAREHLGAGQFDQAIGLMQELHDAEPEELRFAFQLARCLQALGRLADCRQVVESILSSQQTRYQELVARVKQQQDAETPSDGPKPGSVSLVSFAQLELLQGSLLLAEGDQSGAMNHLLAAEELDSRLPTLHQQIGRCYLKLKRSADAQRAYEKAIEIDPDSADAHHGLAISFLRSKRYQEAASEALRAVGILHHTPLAHYHLGVALVRMNHIERATQALQVALSMNPNIIRAHRLLAGIYRRQGNVLEAKKHADVARHLAGSRRK